MAYTVINKPSSYFNTITYTGTGATNSLTGVNFKPDWVWIKQRSSTTWHNLYDINNIDQLIIPNKIYDIVLIDGPNGVNRSKWYSKIRNHIAYHTIMLIDDYNHYTEFETELNRNYNYTILSLSDEPFKPYGEHSWRIITNITLKDY
jgi:hypothetical protein